MLAEDETYLNLLPHVRASSTLRGAGLEVLTPDKNRRITVLGALEVTTSAWMYRLGCPCAADFIALLDQLLQALPHAPAIVVICDDDSIHHARKVTAYLKKQPRPELLYGAWRSPYDNRPSGSGALENYVASTAVSWPGPAPAAPLFFQTAHPMRCSMPPRPGPALAATGLRTELLECC